MSSLEETKKVLGQLENYYTMKYGMDYTEDEKPMNIDQALEAIQSIVSESLGKDAPTHPKDYGLHATVERNLNARLQSIRKDWGIDAR